MMVLLHTRTHIVRLPVTCFVTSFLLPLTLMFASDAQEMFSCSFLQQVWTSVQEFINNLLDECAKCGITDISDSVPETVWHQGGNMTVEDTLREAVNIGHKMFNLKPSLILILLPGNGMHCLIDCSSAANCCSVSWVLLTVALQTASGPPLHQLVLVYCSASACSLAAGLPVAVATAVHSQLVPERELRGSSLPQRSLKNGLAVPRIGTKHRHTSMQLLLPGTWNEHCDQHSVTFRASISITVHCIITTSASGWG